MAVRSLHLLVCLALCCNTSYYTHLLFHEPSLKLAPTFRRTASCPPAARSITWTSQSSSVPLNEPHTAPFVAAQTPAHPLMSFLSSNAIDGPTVRPYSPAPVPCNTKPYVATQNPTRPRMSCFSSGESSATTANSTEPDSAASHASASPRMRHCTEAGKKQGRLNSASIT